MFDAYDDLSILSNDLTRSRGLTALVILRNEMYMLPPFLDYYRALGIERFVMLDDQSDDGTREFLAAQPDVMVVGSPLRYGDVVAPKGGIPLPDLRSNIVWRNVLMSKYASDTWAIMVDADEFIALPDGVNFVDVAARAERSGARAVIGVMLDLYPARLSDLARDEPFDPRTGWFFDGQEHLRLRPGGGVSVTYSGARARLMVQYGIVRIGLKRRLRNLVKPPVFPGFSLNRKAVMHRWGDSDLFLNAHVTTARASGEILLPIRHYKFNQDLYRRIEAAITERRYAAGSKHYDALADLMERMSRTDGSFLYRHSRSASDFDAFVDSRNAVLE